MVLILAILGVVMMSMPYLLRDKKKDISPSQQEVMSFVVTQNRYPEIGTVFDWAKEEKDKIKTDYKGALG